MFVSPFSRVPVDWSSAQFLFFELANSPIEITDKAFQADAKS
jgi:hypothetical protein